jgi:hypothetical protein
VCDTCRCVDVWMCICVPFVRCAFSYLKRGNVLPLPTTGSLKNDLDPMKSGCERGGCECESVRV